MNIDILSENIKKQFSSDILKTNTIGEKRLIILIRNESLLEIANYFHEELKFRFIIASAYLVKNGIEILYHFSDDKTGYIININVLLQKENAAIESLANILHAANWIEREIHDLYGVTFLNHPDPVPFIGEENWDENEPPYLKTREENI